MRDEAKGLESLAVSLFSPVLGTKSAESMSYLLDQDVEMEAVPSSFSFRRHIGVTSLVFLDLNRIIGTGIFSIPSSIYQSLGSVGWTILLMSFGGILAACGFTVYLEYGLQMPHSGGEKNYLARVFDKPPRLMLTVFAVSAVILSFSTSNSYAFGNYVQLAFGRAEPNEATAKNIAFLTVSVIIGIHEFFPKFGRAAVNYLGFAKVFILALIAGSGPLLALGWINVDNGDTYNHNFGQGLWKNDGFGGDLYDIGIALIRVSYSYRGWETANMVMGEVIDPERTVKKAGIIAISTITALYTLCTYAYFSLVPKEEVANSGVIIAGVFLRKLFGESAASRALPLVICMSNLGNILVVTYAAGRVTQEVGKHNILPCSDILKGEGPYGGPNGMILHGLMTALTLYLPPPGEVYNFVVDTSTYPVTVFAAMITTGLLVVHTKPEKFDWNINSYKAPNLAIYVFLTTAVMMIVFPWIPPPTHTGEMPYYASTLASLVVLGLGAAYWYARKDYILQQEAPDLGS